ncbi:MAG: toxic anion resistance protein, partial [Methyloprofundus sp.]|nr:toxic anion resistance protein [Methyloprofundus sp.]
VIPAKALAAESSEAISEAQELRDLRAARDDLERRVHDLRLTRQVAMQSLPGIRLVQDNDKGLVNKINSTIVNTIPLWRQQLATAVAIYRSSDAAGTLQAATDLTNELLEANAENLKLANAETRKELERGVFDLESIKKANNTLIDTINESLQIADEGKKMRAEAVVQLQECETELRKTLSSAASRTSEIKANQSA